MFFQFFLIIGWYFLITAVIRKIFNPAAEFAMPIEETTNETKTELKIHPMKVEIKISDHSLYFKVVQTYFVLLSH